MSVRLPLHRSLALAVVTLLAGCASAPGKAPSSPSLNALYGQLDASSKGYENALRQAREGDDQASQKTLVAALDQLKKSSALCDSTPGCEPQRFYAVFDRLLQLLFASAAAYQ